jgi:hypothetical protein
MTVNQKAIDESDKPFYLAVGALASLVIVVIYCLWLGQYNPTYLTLWKDVALVFSPLVTMAWAFYFKAKL